MPTDLDRTTLRLVVALGVVCLFPLYWFIRIVVGTLSSVRESRQPKLQLHHVELGRLTFYRGVWVGHRELNGCNVEFHVAGTPDGPVPTLVPTAVRILNHPESVTHDAIEYMIRTQAQDPFLGNRKLDHEVFTLECISVTKESQPDSFSLEFDLQGEPNGVWRVDFKEGKPVFSGYED